MALIKCPDCGREIADSAFQCIHCGSRNTSVGNREKEARRFFRGVAIFGGTFGLIVYSIFAFFLTLIIAIFSWKAAIIPAIALFALWWFWIKAIKKTRV